jgi:hypothetical protein
VDALPAVVTMLLLFGQLAWYPVSFILVRGGRRLPSRSVLWHIVRSEENHRDAGENYSEYTMFACSAGDVKQCLCMSISYHSAGHPGRGESELLVAV